jgi:hypothetical protein
MIDTIIEHEDQHDHDEPEPQSHFGGLHPDLAEHEGELGQDRHEDQQRHPVADAALGDQLTEPHDEGGAGGHGEHDEGDVPPGL